MIGLKALCIDDKNRPNEIPISKWVKANTIYTIVGITKSKINGSIGFKLKELNIDDCFPYTSFSINRFAIELVDIKKLIEKQILTLEEI